MSEASPSKKLPSRLRNKPPSAYRKAFDTQYYYENRLIQALNATTAVSYTYDADGSRVARTANGVTTRYLVDKNRDFPQVLEARDTNGSIVVSYTYGDDLISQRQGGGVSYFHYDGFGSVRALTDSLQNITDTYTYDAFGGLIAETGATLNHYLFSGEQYDPHVGFYYLRARYMDPQIGRFQTMDKVAGLIYELLSLHKYLYAKSDPVNNADPSGNFTIGGLISVLNISVSRALASISSGFAISRALGGIALRTLGLTVERSVGILLTRLLGRQAVIRGVALVGTGGRWVLDFWLQIGQRVAVLEVKYQLPLRAGEALTRLVGQMRTALTADVSLHRKSPCLPCAHPACLSA